MGVFFKGAAILLIGSGVILAFMQLKENQVECYSPSASSVPRDYVNSVCINRGLYTVNKNTSVWRRWALGKQEERTYYPSYRYLWVYLIVGGLLALIPLKFEDTTTLPSLLKTRSNCPDKKEMRRKNALKFVFNSLRCSTFFYRHFLAVVFLPLTLFLIILSLSSYLNGLFIILPYLQYKDSLDEIFPKFASCDVNVTSPVLTFEVATCELLQNDFNRTIFLVLWYFLIPVWSFALFVFTIYDLQTMFTPFFWATDIVIDGGIAEEDKTKFKEQIKTFKKLRIPQALVVLQLRFLMGPVEYREFIKELEKRLVPSDADDLEKQAVSDADKEGGGGISIC